MDAHPPSSPALDRLRVLSQSGEWAFATRTDETGQLDDLVGVRVRADYTDVIRVRSDTDAAALRMRNADGADPGGVVWSTDGTVTDVVDGLLALPEPCSPMAPHLVTGVAPTLWAPTGSRTARPTPTP